MGRCFPAGGGNGILRLWGAWRPGFRGDEVKERLGEMLRKGEVDASRSKTFLEAHRDVFELVEEGEGVVMRLI